MAKGSDEKKLIFNKLLTTFPEAFWEETDKKLRIPVKSLDGELIEIRVTLTACKDILGDGKTGVGGGLNFEQGDGPVFDEIKVPEVTPAAPVVTEVTEQEKENLRKMMELLNL